jgi:hypothetical protein
MNQSEDELGFLYTGYLLSGGFEFYVLITAENKTSHQTKGRENGSS